MQIYEKFSGLVSLALDQQDNTFKESISEEEKLSNESERRGHGQDFSTIKSVIYPGLPSHDQHYLATKQQKNPLGESIYGSMISFECKTLKAREMFLEKTRLFTLAESLGGVESLMCVPYEMTHASVPSEIKKLIDLSPNLVRLSVGIEYIEDLIDDLAQALNE